jgi:hypothetical protein
MSKRMLARHKRIFATNNSPATPAAAKTGSGRDHRDPMVFLRRKFIRSYNAWPATLRFGIQTKAWIERRKFELV